MITEAKGARLLQGFRGRPAADLDALEDTLARVSYLATHLEGHLAELDINPLTVLPPGQGVKAADALRCISRYIALHVAESLTQTA
jgi:acetate---CoA ligase (ADP-forming)